MVKIIRHSAHRSSQHSLPTPLVAYIGQQGARPHALGARQAVTGIDVVQTQVAILRVAWQLRVLAPPLLINLDDEKAHHHAKVFQYLLYRFYMIFIY